MDDKWDEAGFSRDDAAKIRDLFNRCKIMGTWKADIIANDDEWSGAGLNLWWTDWPDPVMGANAELARLIDDVQKNHNRGD